MKSKHSFYVALLLSSVAFLGCTRSANDTKILTPIQTFSAYHAFSQTNDDFDSEQTYFAQTKIDDVAKKLPAYQKRWDLNSIHAVKTKYMKFVQRTASCIELQDAKETINGSKALVCFHVKDVCSGHNGAVQKVTMIFINGVWKIEDVELVL